MVDKLQKFNLAGGGLVLIFLILSFFWEYGVPLFVGTGCVLALINFFISDYEKTKRLERLESKLDGRK